MGLPSREVGPHLPQGVSTMSLNAPPVQRPERNASPVVLVVVLLLAISAFQVAAMMITPALPKISERLDATPAQISFSQTLFFAIGGLTAAALPLSDRFGRHRMLVTVLVLGIVGSVLIAVTDSLVLFDVGRWMQATGVVALPLSYLILRDQVTADLYPVYLGWLNALNTGVTGIDGLIAGRMADTIGYQGIFWIAAGFGVAALACVVALVPRTAAVSRTTDWPGILTLGAGVVLLSTGLAQTADWGWTDAGTLGLLGAGAALIAVFVAVERASARPLVQVSYLANRRVWGLALVILVGMAGFMGVFGLLMPFWAELPESAGGFGISATEFSLAAFPGTVLALCLAPSAGFLARRTGWRPILMASTAFAAVALAGLVFAIHSAAPSFILLALVTCAFAGGAMTAANALGVLFSPAESPAFLPGIVSVMFSFGSSLGFAVGGSWLARDTVDVPGAPPIPTESAFTATFAMMAVLVAVGAVLTLLVPRSRAAASKRSADEAPALAGETAT